MPLITEARILIVATDGFEEWELFGPRQILQQRGAEVVLASPKANPIQATVHDDPGKTIRPDLTVDEARAEDFDALILPGGVRNPDHLRTNVKVIQLIKDFDAQRKPVAAICHGPWLLVEAGAVSGRTLTSWPSLKTDIRNAGGQWVDQPVSIDDRLITSRKPADIPAFSAAIVKQFANRMDEARVDELSEQSFPASDPPPGPSSIGGEGAALTQ